MGTVCAYVYSKESSVRAISLARIAEGILKETNDAANQVAWLQHTGKTITVDGLRPVKVLKSTRGSYVMEFVHGAVLADVPNTEIMHKSILCLLAQIEVWGKSPPDNDTSWAEYIERLYSHAVYVGSRTGMHAVDIVAAGTPFARSWCHGDMTLENMLVNDSGVTMIDPNYQSDLYQSYMLDYGKILQSTHTSFHAEISPRYGNLGYAREIVENHLRERDQYIDALRACLSHVVRLLSHWPAHTYRIETIIQDLISTLATNTESRIRGTYQ